MNISQYFAQAQTQIGRTMLAAIVTIALIFAVTAPALAVIAPPAGQIGNDEVNFIAVEYDTPTPGQSTWYYEIKSGDRPAISHVNFKLGNCVHILDAGAWDGDDTGSRISGGGQPEPGSFPAAPKTDPSTGITGLKFDQGFEDGETRYYYFTVNGNYPSADAIVATKGGNGFDTGLVTGVSQVACDAGSLSVTKEVAWAEVTSDASQTFQICINGSSFPIGSEEGACKSIGADGGTLTWENLIAGDYIVIESDPGENWVVSGSGVSVTVPKGHLAEHTVTNTAKQPLPGAISACKFDDLNGNGVQDEDEPSISDWQMDIYEGVPAEGDEPIVSALTEGEGGFVTFENLLPGEYTVCEGEVDGWLPTTGLCQTIIVGSEQVTSVTFGNVRGARILVDKITDPAEAADVFDFELLKGETAISFSLAGGGDAFDSGLLFPGVYSIAELETEGWALDDITCVNVHEENAASDLSNPATIALQAGQVVVCTFTNTKKTPVTPEPTPVTPEPTPVTPEPTPVTPEPTPVTPEPTPVTPEPTPVTPEPTPVTPEPTPVTPEPTPVTPEPTPVTPEPTPVTPEPTPVPVGSLTVTKQVEWNGEAAKDMTFTICIQGPSFPNENNDGACHDFDKEGGSHTWRDLLPGSYTVTEVGVDADEWEVTGSAEIVVINSNEETEHTVINEAIDLSGGGSRPTGLDPEDEPLNFANQLFLPTVIR